MSHIIRKKELFDAIAASIITGYENVTKDIDAAATSCAKICEEREREQAVKFAESESTATQREIQAKISFATEEMSRLMQQKRAIKFMADGSSAVIKDRLYYKAEGVDIAIENLRQSISQLKTQLPNE